MCFLCGTRVEINMPRRQTSLFPLTGPKQCHLSEKMNECMVDFTLQSLPMISLYFHVHQSNLSQFLFLQQQLHQLLSQEPAGARHHAHIASQGHHAGLCVSR